jgi:hypothetical protein
VDPDSKVLWIRIRIEEKCWIQIRIRNESIRIHNPAKYNASSKDLKKKKYGTSYNSLSDQVIVT